VHPLRILELIILAALAAVVLFQLYAVLGRRVGRGSEATPRARVPPVEPQRLPAPAVEAPASSTGLAAMRARDPGFDVSVFLQGARQAYQMIVSAFAAGDLATLRPLLSSNLYGEFGRAISERPHREPADAIRFEGSVEAEIVDAGISGREVHIQVRFASRQMHPGETVPPEEETIDLWSFSRDLGSRDPNWQVIETATGQ